MSTSCNYVWVIFVIFFINEYRLLPIKNKIVQILQFYGQDVIMQFYGKFPNRIVSVLQLHLPFASVWLFFFSKKLNIDFLFFFILCCCNRFWKDEVQIERNSEEDLARGGDNWEEKYIVDLTASVKRHSNKVRENLYFICGYVYSYVGCLYGHGQ